MHKLIGAGQRDSEAQQKRGQNMPSGVVSEPSGTVLFVDDEPHILKALGRLFMDEPYRIYTFTNPSEALEALAQTEASVVVSDHRMPEMEGITFLEKVGEIWPDTVRIIMTGFGDLEIATAAINKGGIYRFINKPWDDRELKLVVKTAVDRHTLLRENKRLLALTKKQNEELALLNQNLEKKVEERTRALKQNERKLEEALVDTIRAMAMTVERRDPYTAGHQSRVADLAGAIASEMALPKARRDGIRMAGMIHDIGKISAPSDILSKPGVLNEHELGLIKTHPQVGYDILEKIAFPWPVAQIVLQHHERMDSSGYPQGLSGNAIILEARIIAIADVVEAMASHRPYRPALGMDKALNEISANRGILYDKEVVDACLKLFREKGFEFT
ncbi:MAG: response regulator [Desulfobacteraceae bacterium]|jgi:putative nucleotidyltransferase with HDIG domain